MHNHSVRLAIALLVVGIPAHAAVTAATRWDVKTTGAATNGAGFDPTIANAGTDMSVFANKNATACTSCQSATVNISKTDAVTNNTTTVTSASANFSSALIGNTVYLTGTGTTTGWYQCTAVGSSTSITVDRATGSTGGSGVTINIGGALRNLADANSGGVVAGNTVYVQATATYSISAALAASAAGSSGLPITYTGYTTSQTDGGTATIQASAGAFNLISSPGAFTIWENFTVDCNSQSNTRAFNIVNNFSQIIHVTAKNCTIANIALSGNNTLISNSLVTACTSGCTNGALVVAALSRLDNVRVTANVSPGIVTSGGYEINRCIVDANTGASSDGIQVTVGTSTAAQTIRNTVSYNNGRDGLRYTAAAAADGASVRNSIFISNAGYGINSTTTNWTAGLDVDYNAFYNNTTNPRNQFPTGAHDVTVTGVPFTNAGSGDFSLNNTASQGAALRAAGFPGVLISGGTGYLDIGALQHQDAGGSSAVPSYPIGQ